MEMDMPEMKTDFFYSKSTKLFVSRKPLKIDSRVKKSAEQAGIKLCWDDEGRINFVDFDAAKKILASLGAIMLSPVDYWKVLEDAKREKDKEMIQELMSNSYCEWLDRVYLIDKNWIDHPEIIGNYNYSGKKEKSVEPIGRPGWFNPKNNIDFDLGIPKKIELFREKFANSWKYWSPDFSVTAHKPRAPLRGYVTSVGKPSFDQGIPVNAKQPMQMIRECRKEPLEPPIDANVLEKALSLTKQCSLPEKNFEQIIGFLEKNGALFQDSKQAIIYKIREKFFDLLGLLKITALTENDTSNIAKIDKSCKALLGFELRQTNYGDFIGFMKKTKSNINEALKQKKDIVFVMGHKNPDTDTVISSLFESWRNHVLDQGKIIYAPVVQSHKIPDEVRRLLGDLISDCILLDCEKEYIKAKKSGLARWISVDQNREPEIQRYFISIIDHHLPSEISLRQDMPKTMEIIGSSTALVLQKMLGMGMHPDRQTAKILQGAALMDTENRVIHKMTKKDRLLMDFLKKISEIYDENEFYSDLMSFLLNTDDPTVLFGRDYKEDWGFGFAVAKIKRGFGIEGKELKKDLIKKAVDLAKQNNALKNFPLTVMRITDYHDDNITVNRERVYLIFNEKSPKEFKSAIFDLLEKIVKFEFGDVNIRSTKEYIEFWGTGMQLSRKKTAPILEPVVKTFNEFFYSPSNDIWIKRDFLKKSKNVLDAAQDLKLKISFDKEERVNYVTYPEARQLVEKLGFSILSLREYWLALNDAKKIKDSQMIASLQGSNFVEFLDTVFKEHSIMIEHPKIIKTYSKFSFKGNEVKVSIPKGKPGLIHPDQIDLKTGIPNKVRSPSEYGNSDLWRYWEPDLDLVIPARSYIFLLKQPCWDGKFHTNDSFPNLGIRACCKKPPTPKVETIIKGKNLQVIIQKEGNKIKFSWNKNSLKPIIGIK